MSVHLHTRSCYTLLESTLRIQDIVALAKAQNMEAVALCDRNVMHGAMAFYRACKKANIKPIYGLEFELVENEQHIDLIAYAKNDLGFQSLLALSTHINTTSKTLTLETFQPFDRDLIVCTAGNNDDLRRLNSLEDKSELESLLLLLKRNFLEFYIAIAMNDSLFLRKQNEILKNLARKLGIDTFALSKIYYANKEDFEAYQVLNAIGQQRTIFDKTLSVEQDRYFRSSQEMEGLYTEDDLAKADAIAADCNVHMQMEKANIPVFENNKQVDSATYLRELCRLGLQKRLHNKVSHAYVERLQHELDVIERMGFSDYFLIVYDFVRYAKMNDIYVGPGRGSAAGSLVSYCIGITEVDPLRYGLLFERFLNPERISMPDIDIDFPDNRRDEVIAYVAKRYGKDRVAHITTFGSLGAKQVLRDVGRVLAIPLSDVDLLCKMVPNVLKINLDAVYKQNKKFAQAIQAKKEFKRLFLIARKLEGLPRHASTHAGGIVLSNKPISSVCPLIAVEDDLYSTQYTMEYLEDLGLIKIDFLGLRNLTIIDEVVSHIKAHGQNLDVKSIPLDDPETFKLLQAVDTVGVFQLESEGMKSLLHKMQVKNFEEIAATIALFRPGPMENIPLYLANRQHPEKIDYMDPTLQPILKNTYGVMIYQEQIMQITQVMAGFSLGKADILRKAISKKIPGELEKLENDFIVGSVKNGYDESLAHRVYDSILKFAGYGFNRSHSIAYGLIAYQMAYLKARYPLSFFTSLLNSMIGAETKSSEYIFEAKKRGIKILPPSVNASTAMYEIENECIRFPLLGIKNIGRANCEALLQERATNGVYTDFFDFVARISTVKFSSKAIECLIDAGALDDFNETRASLRATLPDALRYASLVKVDEVEQQLDLTLVSKPPMVVMRDYLGDRARKEKDVLGFYLSEHPITQIRSRFAQDVKGLIELANYKGYVKTLGFIEHTKQHRTKGGDIMMFVIISDETSKFDLAVFPKEYQIYQDILVRGNYVYVEGFIKDRPSISVNKLQKVEAE